MSLRRLARCLLVVGLSMPVGSCCQAADFVDRMGAAPFLDATQLREALADLPAWEAQGAADHALRSYHWKRDWREGATVDALCRRGERVVHVGLFRQAGEQRLVLYTCCGEGLREDLRALHGALTARVAGVPRWDEMEERTNLPRDREASLTAIDALWWFLLAVVLVALGGLLAAAFLLNRDRRAHPRPGLHL